MARPLRIEYVGGFYHVTGRGNERRAVFRDNRDLGHFLELLAALVDRFGVRVHGYVLMDNHYHLLIELIEVHLSRAMQWLNLSYTAWFNRRHDRVGHLFQGRFKSVLFDAAEAGLELSRYVHLNPVRVRSLGLDKDRRHAARQGIGAASGKDEVEARLARLRDYHWSSYRACVGAAECPPWLEASTLIVRSKDGKARNQEHYRRYVESAVREGMEADSPWGRLREGVILGGGRFVEKLRERVKGDAQEQRAARRIGAQRWTWRQVVEAAEEVQGEAWDQWSNRYGNRMRDLVLYLGQSKCGLKLNELAELCGMNNYAAAAMAIRRYKARLASDKAEARRMNEVIELLNVKM